jgi:hypothetical protein
MPRFTLGGSIEPTIDLITIAILEYAGNNGDGG